MDDLFNFGGIDGNILGDDPILGTQRSSSGGMATTPSNHSVSRQDSHNNDKGFDSEQKHKDNPSSFKVVIVGDPQVGKTSFLTKHLNGTFDAQYRATVGASTVTLEFNTKYVECVYTAYPI